jgi:hypothetical protein
LTTVAVSRADRLRARSARRAARESAIRTVSVWPGRIENIRAPSVRGLPLGVSRPRSASRPRQRAGSAPAPTLAHRSFTGTAPSAVSESRRAVLVESAISRTKRTHAGAGHRFSATRWRRRSAARGQRGAGARHGGRGLGALGGERGGSCDRRRRTPDARASYQCIKAR